MENLLKKILGEKEGKGEDTSDHESESAKKEWLSKFHMDGIKKTISLRMKENDWNQFRQNLGSCQANLQMLSTALNLSVHAPLANIISNDV